MNTIQTDTVAVISYTLHTADGHLIDKGEKHAYLQGHGHLLWGMEKALEGKSADEEIKVMLEPGDAFGNFIEEAEPIRIHQQQFGAQFDKLEKGMPIPIKTPDGQESVLYVQSNKGNYASLTRNHPLAGISLIFNASIINVRCALPEEIARQMAFGPDGNKAPSSCACC